MPFCGKCGTQMDKNDKFCKKCGSPASRIILKCRSCGNEIKKDFKFCGMCGAPIGNDNTVGQFTDNANKPSTYLSKMAQLFNQSQYFEAFSVSEEAYQRFPTNIDIIVFYESSLTLQISLDEEADAYRNEDFRTKCVKLIEVATKLKGDASYSDLGIKDECIAHYCLGRHYYAHNDYNSALIELKQVDVRQRPRAACFIVYCHMYMISKLAQDLPVKMALKEINSFAAEFRNDVNLLNLALTSSPIISKDEKAEIWLVLSELFVKDYPGLSQNIKYAYDCVRQAYSLRPDVASAEIKKFKSTASGSIIYEP